MLPNALLAGMPKCGTTALYHWFDQRDDTFVPSVKEPHTLAELSVSGMGDFASYDAAFRDAGEPRRLDCSTSAVLHADRIVANVQRYDVPVDVVLIVYRDPVERCISHWNYARKIGQDDRHLADVSAANWRTPNDPWQLQSAYLEPGLLAPGLRVLVQSFDRVRVLPYSAMRSRPEAFLREVARALDLPPMSSDPRLEERNVSVRPRGVVGTSVLNVANAFGANRVAWPRPVRSLARRAFIAGSSDLADAVDVDVRCELDEFYAADRADVRQMMAMHPEVFPMESDTERVA